MMRVSITILHRKLLMTHFMSRSDFNTLPAPSQIETPERSLATLPRIAEALQLVESAVAQGPYADRLLLFRGVRQSALRGAGRNLALTTGTVYGDVQPLAPAAPGSSAIDEGSRSRRMSRASNLSQGSLARTVTDMSDAPGTRHSPVSMDHLWDYSCSLFEGKASGAVRCQLSRTRMCMAHQVTEPCRASATASRVFACMT